MEMVIFSLFCMREYYKHFDFLDEATKRGTSHKARYEGSSAKVDNEHVIVKS